MHSKSENLCHFCAICFMFLPPLAEWSVFGECRQYTWGLYTCSSVKQSGLSHVPTSSSPSANQSVCPLRLPMPLNWRHCRCVVDGIIMWVWCDGSVSVYSLYVCGVKVPSVSVYSLCGCGVRYQPQGLSQRCCLVL